MADERNELEDIKRLLVLLLLKIGTTQDEIGAALGVSQATVSRLVPAAKIKKLKD